MTNERGSIAGNVAITLGVIVGAVALVLLVASMQIFGWGLFQRATANFRGQTGAIEQTQANADFRLHAYNHFFDLCSAVQADEGRLQSLKQELRSRPSAERRTEIEASLTGVRSNRLEDIRQYNVDAAKSFTVGQFRDSQLPYQLDPRRRTTCVVSY